MEVSQLPLNALRAFEASARHSSFTRAGLELRVTQTAISHQVEALEEVLDVTLFKRLPRGLALTRALQKVSDRHRYQDGSGIADEKIFLGSNFRLSSPKRRALAP
jgi:Bacterial regulatory helix-turn-helix protein, lysR family